MCGPSDHTRETPNAGVGFIVKDNLTIVEALNIVQFYAVKVEQNDASKSTNPHQIANVGSNSQSSGKPIPGTIGGHKVDNKGFINRDTWDEID